MINPDPLGDDSPNDPLRRWFVEHGHPSTESPMEAMFECALRLLIGREASKEYITVECQAPIGLCDGRDGRADFMISAWGYRLYVEIDGFAFHERTSEQAAADRARDRHLHMIGYPPIRFMGRDVWLDPIACALQALNCLRNMANRDGAQ